MRDPDSGWINASIYRVQVHGKNKVTIQFDHPGRHGAIIAKKYWDRGESCPLAIVHGEDPALPLGAWAEWRWPAWDSLSGKKANEPLGVNKR